MAECASQLAEKGGLRKASLSEHLGCLTHHSGSIDTKRLFPGLSTQTAAPPDPVNAKAAPAGPRNGSHHIKKSLAAFEDGNYRSNGLRSIPSPEKNGLHAQVVQRGERLFAVGYFAAGVAT